MQLVGKGSVLKPSKTVAEPIKPKKQLEHAKAEKEPVVKTSKQSDAEAEQQLLVEEKSFVNAQGNFAPAALADSLAKLPDVESAAEGKHVPLSSPHPSFFYLFSLSLCPN